MPKFCVCTHLEGAFAFIGFALCLIPVQDLFFHHYFARVENALHIDHCLENQTYSSNKNVVDLRERERERIENFTGLHYE